MNCLYLTEKCKTTENMSHIVPEHLQNIAHNIFDTTANP